MANAVPTPIVIELLHTFQSLCATVDTLSAIPLNPFSDRLFSLDSSQNLSLQLSCTFGKGNVDPDLLKRGEHGVASLGVEFGRIMEHAEVDEKGEEAKTIEKWLPRLIEGTKKQIEKYNRPAVEIQEATRYSKDGLVPGEEKPAIGLEVGSTPPSAPPSTATGSSNSPSPFVEKRVFSVEIEVPAKSKRVKVGEYAEWRDDRAPSPERKMDKVLLPTSTGNAKPLLKSPFDPDTWGVPVCPVPSHLEDAEGRPKFLLPFRRQTKDCPTRSDGTSAGNDLGGNPIDSFSKYLCLRPEMNIMPSFIGGPFLIYSTKSWLDKVRTVLATNTSKRSVFFRCAATMKDSSYWFYFGEYTSFHQGTIGVDSMRAMGRRRFIEMWKSHWNWAIRNKDFKDLVERGFSNETKTVEAAWEEVLGGENDNIVMEFGIFKCEGFNMDKFEVWKANLENRGKKGAPRKGQVLLPTEYTGE